MEYNKINNTIIRPIHYLGSKLRILDTIKNVVDTVNPSFGRICDLFAGSGTVSHYLSYSRPVTSVDIQEYSRVLCSAALMPVQLAHSAFHYLKNIEESEHFSLMKKAFEPVLSYEQASLEKATHGKIEDLYDIIENGSIIISQKESLPLSSKLSTTLKETLLSLKKYGLDNSKSTMVTRYFGGLYFSYEQAICIDASLEYIFSYANNNLPIKDFMLAALLGATSDIVNTVGKQFAQPLQVKTKDGKLKHNLLKKILTDRSLSFFESFVNWLNEYISLNRSPFDSHESLCMDYYEALSQLKQHNISVVYADPPYTRYHYSRYYHVLETICLRDMPDISTTFSNGTQISRGLYRKDRHQSPFCIKSQAGKAFDKLFYGVANLGVPLILSYSPFSESSLSTPRMQTISQLIEKANTYYHSVDLVSPGHFSHSKLNSVDKNFIASDEAEQLIVCQNPK